MTAARGAFDASDPAEVDARLLARRLEAWAGDGTLACWIEDDPRVYELALALAERLAEREA